MPSPGGQTSGMASRIAVPGPGGQDVASRRPPSRATARHPGGRAPRRTHRSRRGRTRPTEVVYCEDRTRRWVAAATPPSTPGPHRHYPQVSSTQVITIYGWRTMRPTAHRTSSSRFTLVALTRQRELRWYPRATGHPLIRDAQNLGPDGDSSTPAMWMRLLLNRPILFHCYLRFWRKIAEMH
jgi:hypothetical protein